MQTTQTSRTVKYHESQINAMFLSLRQIKSLDVETQSMFIALWAHCNMEYALNFVLMPEFCTKLNIFGLSVLLKQLSASKHGLYNNLVKEIWIAILENPKILTAILKYKAKYLASHSIECLIHCDKDLDIALKILNATSASKQQQMSWETLKNLLERLQDSDTQRVHGWVLDVIWKKSIQYSQHPNQDQMKRKEYMELMVASCDLYNSSTLKQKVLQKYRYCW